MIITDTHTHLYSEEFADDRDEMIARAINAGVTRFFVPAIDSNYTQAMFDLEKKYPDNVFLMCGLHPVYVNENFEEELALVEAELSRRKYCAVGEIGIDMYWDISTFPMQQIAFRPQIKLANQNKLPINIPCPAAFVAIFECLEEAKGPALRGIFHCFS